MINISVTALSHIERGRRSPSPQLLENIAWKLGVPGEELFIIEEDDDAPKITRPPGGASGG